MNDVIKIIENLSSFLQYIVPGCLFLWIYNFTAAIQREEQAHYLFIKCISISWALCICTGSRIWLSAVIAVVLGVVLGKLRNRTYINCILARFFNCDFQDNSLLWLIERANNEDSVLEVSLKLKNDDSIYSGIIYAIYSPYKDAKILLKKYDEQNPQDELLINYSDIEKFKIIRNDIPEYKKCERCKFNNRCSMYKNMLLSEDNKTGEA